MKYNFEEKFEYRLPGSKKIAAFLAADHPKLRVTDYPCFVYNTETGDLITDRENHDCPLYFERAIQIYSQSFDSIKDFFAEVDKYDLAYIFNAESIAFAKTAGEYSTKFIIRWAGIHLEKPRKATNKKPVFIEVGQPVFLCNPYTGYCGKDNNLLYEAYNNVLLPPRQLTAFNRRFSTMAKFHDAVKDYDVVYVHSIQTMEDKTMIIRSAMLNLNERK